MVREVRGLASERFPDAVHEAGVAAVDEEGEEVRELPALPGSRSPARWSSTLTGLQPTVRPVAADSSRAALRKLSNRVPDDS
ncbi:hypothetical protein ACH4ZX_30890 [Streptomyces sp. NPDC020490]|uniref:hypothetical protein n=1 Tax=Streptomyces sp. NPDC020490 TaxID=3365078 RepID=UPI003794343C